MLIFYHSLANNNNIPKGTKKEAQQALSLL